MQVFSNLGYARLAATIDETAAVMVVKDSKGIPSLNGGEYFLATLFKGSGERTENVEIVKVVGVDGNVWQIERNIEDTEPVTHFENTAIELRLTKGGLEQSGKQVLKPANTIVESNEKQFTSASEKESINDALSALQELAHSKVSKENINAPNGIASLNESGELSENQLPLKTVNGESLRGEGNIIIEAGVGPTATVATIEFTVLPPQVKELSDWVIQVTAKAFLQEQSIVEFVASWSDGTTCIVPATAGAATLIKAAPAHPESLSVGVYAVDSLNNQTLTINASVDAIENAPPTGPITINHATSTSPSGTIDVALSGATDPDGDTSALRYEIVDAGGLTFNKVIDIEAGEIIQATAPADNVEGIYAFTVRAYNDFGGITATYRSSLKVLLAQIIGVKLVETGGNGGTWTHIDEFGNEITLPAANWFNSHPVWGGIVDQIIDGQHMVKIPKFYYKRSTAGGKAAWWISDQPADGFAVFPAFVLDGAEVDQFWYGKYQASTSGGKLQSILGVMPQVSTTLTNFLSLAIARNTGGVEGFCLHHYDMWLAIQWLYLIENATMDSQGYTGQGRVSQPSTASVDDDIVAEATYRGMVGLWGNVGQWIDGVRIVNGLIERRNYTGGWIKTGQDVPHLGSDHYPLTFRSTTSCEFIADTFLTSNSGATLPDQVHWGASGENYPLVGGWMSTGANAGLWYFRCRSTAASTFDVVGGRLARIV